MTNRDQRSVKFTLVFVLALLSSSSAGEVKLLAQVSSTPDLTQRLGVLEQAVQSLGREVADLNVLLRSILPPSPIEDVPPIELDISDAVSKGATTAKVVLIEFSDFQCPFCARHFQAVYPGLQRQFVDTGRVRYVFRNLPIAQLHPLALKAAEAGECARDQNRFWQMHDQLFSNQNALAPTDLIAHAQALELDLATFTPCLNAGKKSSIIQRDLHEAAKFGLTGTPTFFIGEMQPNGAVRVTKRIVGAQPLKVFEAALQSLLVEKTVSAAE